MLGLVDQTDPTLCRYLGNLFKDYIGYYPLTDPRSDARLSGLRC